MINQEYGFPSICATLLTSRRVTTAINEANLHADDLQETKAAIIPEVVVVNGKGPTYP